MEIKLTLEENLINEFESISKFWESDESKVVKPTIQEIIRKYIIDSINEERIETVKLEAILKTDILKNNNITI